MGIYFIVAMRNLVQARRRTLLLAGALGFVSMLLVLLLALSQGITDTMIRSSTVLYTGHVNVAGFYKAKSTDAWPLVRETPALREIVNENTPGLDYVVDRGRGWAKLISATSSLWASMSGIDVAEEGAFLEKVQLAEEREYKEDGRAEVVGDIRHLAEPGTIFLFAAQAKRLGVVIGDMLTLSAETEGGTSNLMDVRLVAVAKDIGFMSNWNAYLSKATLRQMYQLSDDVSGAVLVYLKDPAQATEVMEHLRDVFLARGYTLMDHQPASFWMKFETVAGEDWVGQKLDLTTWEDEVGMMKWAISALDSISVFLVAIMLFIIVIGIANTMFIAVRERTNEIGTLRAIGMRRGQVLRMVLLEAGILGAFATTVGSALGALLAMMLNALSVPISIEALRAILMSDTLQLSVQPSQILGAIVTFTLITALAALWPAVRAARLVPVTAIHHAE
ncbi:ABC transporter permease [Myxococcota bacterium]